MACLQAQGAAAWGGCEFNPWCAANPVGAGQSFLDWGDTLKLCIRCAGTPLYWECRIVFLCNPWQSLFVVSMCLLVCVVRVWPVDEGPGDVLCSPHPHCPHLDNGGIGQFPLLPVLHRAPPAVLPWDSGLFWRLGSFLAGVGVALLGCSTSLSTIFLERLTYMYTLNSLLSFCTVATVFIFCLFVCLSFVVIVVFSGYLSVCSFHALSCTVFHFSPSLLPQTPCPTVQFSYPM